MSCPVDTGMKAKLKSPGKGGYSHIIETFLKYTDIEGRHERGFYLVFNGSSVGQESRQTPCNWVLPT